MWFVLIHPYVNIFLIIVFSTLNTSRNITLTSASFLRGIRELKDAFDRHTRRLCIMRLSQDMRALNPDAADISLLKA